jgi:hypothetical protein
VTRTSRRRLALATSLVFSLGLLGSIQHRVTELHGYCSEHGRVVHLSVGQVRSPADPRAPVVRHDVQVQGEHDCAALSFLAQTVLISRSSSLGRAEACASRPPVPRRTAPLAAIPLLLQAPKSSPPQPRAG